MKDSQARISLTHNLITQFLKDIGLFLPKLALNSKLSNAHVKKCCLLIFFAQVIRIKYEGFLSMEKRLYCKQSEG